MKKALNFSNVFLVSSPECGVGACRPQPCCGNGLSSGLNVEFQLMISA